VTNLGKYNEGELCGEYLKLPATREDVQSLLARVGVDGVLYEELFITDFETDIDGLVDCLGEYESIDELNYLAAKMQAGFRLYASAADRATLTARIENDHDMMIGILDL